MQKGTLELLGHLSPGYGWLFVVQNGGGVAASCNELVKFERLSHPYQIQHRDYLFSVGVNQERDFIVSIYLRDAYFQISIHLGSQPCLWIALGGRVYQFKVLCFNLSTTP